jgi:hypothetical protein
VTEVRYSGTGRDGMERIARSLGSKGSKLKAWAIDRPARGVLSQHGVMGVAGLG